MSLMEDDYLRPQNNSGLTDDWNHSQFLITASRRPRVGRRSSGQPSSAQDCVVNKDNVRSIPKNISNTERANIAMI